MCDFLSVCMDLEGNKVYAGNLTSHSETAALFGLKADSYLEIEWVDESPDKLIIRTHQDYPHDEAWYRACVLALGKSRAKFLEYCLNNLHPNAEPRIEVPRNGTLDLPNLKKCGSVDLTANATLNAPVLAEVTGYVDLRDATLNAPVLAEVTGSVDLRENATLNAPVLAKTGSVDVHKKAKLIAPKLNKNKSKAKK